MLDYIREGVALKLVDLFESKKITLISVKECVDTGTAAGCLMLQMIAAINKFERANLLERQAEGIAIAKANGKYMCYNIM